MNSSLFAADRLTHVKIALVAMAASLIFVLAGLSEGMDSTKAPAIRSETPVPWNAIERESVKPVLLPTEPGHDRSV